MYACTCYQVGPTEYDLVLRTDKGGGSVQWYYFMVRNMKSNLPYVFNIVNFVKNNSLYNDGLRPLIYSDKEARGKHFPMSHTYLNTSVHKSTHIYPHTHIRTHIHAYRQRQSYMHTNIHTYRHTNMHT